MSKRLAYKSVDDNVDGLIVYSIVQLAGGGMPGIVTDDSATS